MKTEKPIVIELYEFWNSIKARFDIVSPQPKSFTLRKEVMPVTSLDGVAIEIIDLSDATTVTAAGGTNTQTLQPPVGWIYQVIDLGYNANAVGTANNHDLSAKYRDAYSFLLTLESTFANVLKIKFDGFVGSVSEYPSNITEQYKLMRSSIFASHDTPVDFTYTNDTDANQTATRTLKLVVKKFPEGAI